MPPHRSPWPITLTMFADDAAAREYARQRSIRAMLRHIPEGEEWADFFPRRYGLACKPADHGLDPIPALAAVRLKVWTDLRVPDEAGTTYRLAFLSFPVIALLTGCRHNSIVSAFTRAACRMASMDDAT